jgi:uncharacterized protein (DUF58 family)
MATAVETERAGLRTGGSGLLATLERTLGLTLSGLILLGVAVVGWFLAHKFGGRSLYLLAYATVAMLVVALFLARRRRPVSASRSEINRRARVGQILGVEITLQATGRVTSFRVEEQRPEALGRPVIVPVPSIRPGQDIVHRYTLRPTLRGVMTLGPLTAEFTDPMGLAKRHQELVPATEIIVHPNVEELLDRPLTRAFEDPPMRPPRSRPWPQGFEFYGMRDYVPGDDLRRVVWRAYGRTDRLLVREFEQGISDRIAVVLDTDESWNSPGVPSDTFETAVRVAASVGVRHIRDGLTVRLESNPQTLGNFRGPRSRLTYLDELARVQPSSEPLSMAMERMARSDRRDNHVVLVTSHFDQQSAASAHLLINDGASFTVCAIVWEEADIMTMRRANEIGAQVVQLRPGASLRGAFRASLQSNSRGR